MFPSYVYAVKFKYKESRLKLLFLELIRLNLSLIYYPTPPGLEAHFSRIDIFTSALISINQIFKIKTKIMEWYLKVLRNYSDFSGRARRKEYWMFTLFNIIAAIIAMIIDRILGTTFNMSVGGMEQDLGYGYIYLLYALVVLVPGLAVMVRRLHDVGKSGWFLLIVLIPLIGWIWLLVLYCTDSQPFTNKWGPSPKGDLGFGNAPNSDQVV
jgi:uncharacterized membrane protein YhaH (DUF805 family)